MKRDSWHAFVHAAGLAGMLCFLALWLAACGALETSTPPLSATASTAVVKPFPTPVGTRPLYSNALTAPAAGWARGPECVFTSTGLSVRPNGGQAYICLAPTASQADVSITVSVQQLSGPL